MGRISRSIKETGWTIESIVNEGTGGTFTLITVVALKGNARLNFSFEIKTKDYEESLSDDMLKTLENIEDRTKISVFSLTRTNLMFSNGCVAIKLYISGKCSSTPQDFVETVLGVKKKNVECLIDIFDLKSRLELGIDSFMVSWNPWSKGKSFFSDENKSNISFKAFIECFEAEGFDLDPEHVIQKVLDQYPKEKVWRNRSCNLTDLDIVIDGWKLTHIIVDTISVYQFLLVKDDLFMNVSCYANFSELAGQIPKEGTPMEEAVRSFLEIIKREKTLYYPSVVASAPDNKTFVGVMGNEIDISDFCPDAALPSIILTAMADTPNLFDMILVPSIESMIDKNYPGYSINIRHNTPEEIQVLEQCFDMKSMHFDHALCQSLLKMIG